MNRIKIKYLQIVAIIPMLSGCTPSPDEGVKEFVKETKKQKSGYVENVPTFPAPPAIKFAAEDLRDPFDPNSTLRAATTDMNKHQHDGPDLSRPREELEAFAISSLKMVGTIEREGIFYALISDPANVIHLAGIGNYVGENSGRIEKINNEEIDVKEWLPDGKGGWRGHDTSIPFLHEESKNNRTGNDNSQSNQNNQNNQNPGAGKFGGRRGK